VSVRPSPPHYTGVNSAVQGSQWLPGRATNPQGGRTSFSWQPTTGTENNGNLYGVTQTKNDGTHVSGVSFTYEPTGTAINGKAGQLKSVTDGRTAPGVTNYSYDTRGNLQGIDYPAAPPLGDVALLYDQTINRLSVVRDGAGKCRVLSYDSLDRLKKVEFRGACPNTGSPGTLDSTEGYVELTYDRDGNQLTEVTRRDGTTALLTRSMTYDNLNRVTYESLPGGGSNTMTYDRVGNLRSLTDAGGKVEYTYDATNQQRAVYEPGTTKPSKFKYTKDGLLDETKYPNNVTIDWGYDDAFRLTSIKATNAASTVIQELAYKYRDPQTSRQTPLRYEAEDKSLARRTRYAYDGLDRLTNATVKTNSGTDTDSGWNGASALGSWTYTLDPAGNVTQRVVAGSQLPASTTNYQYNLANQLCWRGTGTPPTPNCSTTQSVFDANGNETTNVGAGTAIYNPQDQTTTLRGVTIQYLGLGQDRWTSEGGTAIQHNVLGLGSRGTTYFTRDDGGTLVSRRSGSTRHYYLFDALGSIYGLTGSTGTVSERYDYDPYGGGNPTGAGQLGNGSTDVPGGQFGFAGGYRTTASGIYHYGQRYYDPSSLRWTQTDPLDQTGDLREGNRYTYVGADPINVVDLLGEAGRLKQIWTGVYGSYSRAYNLSKRYAAESRRHARYYANEAGRVWGDYKTKHPGSAEVLERTAEGVGKFLTGGG
jgi:RHS repeat-associated protein